VQHDDVPYERDDGRTRRRGEDCGRAAEKRRGDAGGEEVGSAERETGRSGSNAEGSAGETGRTVAHDGQHARNAARRQDDAWLLRYAKEISPLKAPKRQ